MVGIGPRRAGFRRRGGTVRRTDGRNRKRAVHATLTVPGLLDQQARRLHRGLVVGRVRHPAAASTRHHLARRPTWPTITLHQLLSNTSGLGHWGDVPGLPRLLTSPPPLDELLALIADAPLPEPPGASWRYSGPGFLIAARIVEAVTGRPYAAIADDLVFTPAAMRETTSGPPLPTGPEATVGHDRGRMWPPHPNFASITGSGDLWTTAGDLIRLSQALRTGQLIAPRSATQLWSPHATLRTAASNPGPVVVTSYGYGTFLGEVLGHRARINPGDNPGYQSLLAYLPEHDIDLAVLCNEEAPSLDAALAELHLT
jgi:CubicO group peptidase (beta-lactamase class C family)